MEDVSNIQNFQEVEGKSFDITSVWHYFLRNKTAQCAMCKKCSKILKMSSDCSTSTLHNHLRVIHKMRVPKPGDLTFSTLEDNNESVALTVTEESSKEEINEGSIDNTEEIENGGHTLEQNQARFCNEPSNPSEQFAVNRPLSNFREVEGKSDDKRSVWHYFLRDKMTQCAMCKFENCANVLKMSGGSTTTLHNHLKKIHNIFVEGRKRTSPSPPVVFGSINALFDPILPMHCLLCNEELVEPSPLNQIYCESLCRLFSLDTLKSFSFAIQYFCPACIEKVQHIHVLYQQMEELEAEIRMYCSGFIESIKRQCLENQGQENATVDDARRCLLSDIIQGNDSRSQTGIGPAIPEAEQEMFSLIQPKVECLDMDLSDGFEESDFYPSFTDDVSEPNQSANSGASASHTAGAEIAQPECVEPLRRSLRRTRPVNYKNYIIDESEDDSNDETRELDDDSMNLKKNTRSSRRDASIKESKLSGFQEVEGKCQDKTSVWHYFFRNKKAQCAMCKVKECSKILKMSDGSTSNLHNHLRIVHSMRVPKVGVLTRTSLGESSQSVGFIGAGKYSEEEIEEGSVDNTEENDSRTLMQNKAKKYSKISSHLGNQLSLDRHFLSNFHNVDGKCDDKTSVWHYFLRDKKAKRALCKFQQCSKILKMSSDCSTSTLHNHLRVIHKMRVPKAGGPTVADNSQSAEYTGTEEHSMEGIQESSIDNAGQFENDSRILEPMNSKLFQTPLDRQLSNFQEVEGKCDDKTSVWHYFLRDKQAKCAMCKFQECSKILKMSDGSTTTLHNHLRVIHKMRISKVGNLSSTLGLAGSGKGSTSAEEDVNSENHEAQRQGDSDFENEISASSIDDDSDEEYRTKSSRIKSRKKSVNRSKIKIKVRCPTCSKGFPSRNDLKYHLEFHLPDAERSHVCATCGKGFPKASLLLKHQQTHRKIFKKHKSQLRPSKKAMVLENGVDCPEPGCHLKFQSLNGMRRHVGNHHSNSQHGETLKWLSHKRDPNAIIKCKECGKIFKSNNDLKYHAEIHLPHHERSFQCSICGRGFPKASIRDKHTMVHEGEEAASALPKTLCTVCGNSVINIVFHMRTHRKAPEFHCTVCDKTCKSKKVLQYHQLMHSGDKPYHCDKCPMTFRSNSTMKRHSTIHSDEKKYLCAFCGKAFRLKQNYLEHQHVHTKELPHRCNYCGRRFHLMHELVQHRNDLHDGAITSTKSKQIESPTF